MRKRLAIITRSAAETEGLGRLLGTLARAGEVLALDGPLGAGKTNLVRGLAGGLGLDPRAVSSPTFVLVNIYDQPGDGPGRLIPTPLAHVDAYRLSGADDLESVGWDRVMNGVNVVAVEWAARLDPDRSDALGDPGQRADLVFTPTGPETRSISLDVPGAWMDRADWPALASLAEPESMGPGRCPTCGGPVGPDSPTWPFDHPRCRMADLGRWLSGSYRLSRELREDDDLPPPSVTPTEYGGP